MADKTTTLKTKTNNNVYPNIIGDNRDNAISDSAHINHTLTKDHKINFRLDTNVSGLIFNSLQKPKGLTKTELVGVGANGQENIEIGDNLTLANGKLSASGGGGSSIPVIEGTMNEDFTVTLASAPSANFILRIASLNAYIYMSDIVNSYYGSIILRESNGDITIEAFASKEGSPTILDVIVSTFNPNNIPDIHINSDNLINTIWTHGVDNIDFSNKLKTKFLYVIDTKTIQLKIYPLYYIRENEYKGFGMFMYNNITFLETYTLSIKNNIGTITTVTDGFKTYRLFDEYPILVPKDSADANILPLPSDASTSTYVLKAVNGTVKWVKES